MSNISIVTAFFDIGRENWTPEKGYYWYIQRSAEVYIERFLMLCNLNTDITLVTTSAIKELIQKKIKGKLAKVNFITFDIKTTFSFLREQIGKIQASEDFKRKINSSVYPNPEYKNPDYVLVTNLKAHFVNEAIKSNTPTNDMVAWVDFGYCRDLSKIPTSNNWTYNFDPTKLHLFSYKPVTQDIDIVKVISNNDVFILGAKAIAHKRLWPLFASLMQESWQDLQNINMVDDDQGLWLMSYMKYPEIFKLHEIPDHQLGFDPFILFQKFNDTP